MSRSPRLLTLWTALFATLAAVAAHGEPVRFALGGDLTGQGWMFRDRSGICRIVTAAHNLDAQGKLRSPVAVDASGAEIATADPVWPDRTIDIAFVRAKSARGCSQEGLNFADINTRLAVSPLGFIDIVRDRATSKVAVRLRQRSVDDGGGRILLFESAADAPLMQGLSGAAVQDSNGRPLAIATSRARDDGRLLAVRLDVVAALLDARVLAAAADSSPVAGWSVDNGRSADANAGPERSLDRAGNGWRVETDRGYLSVTLGLKAPQSISAIAMALHSDAAGQVRDIQIFADNAARPDLPFEMLGRCPVPIGGTAVRCAFDRKPGVTKVQIVLRSNLPVLSISGLTLDR